MSPMFQWNKDMVEAMRVSSPITVLHSTSHKARLRAYICSECFAPIHIGDRYFCTAYKDNINGQIGQYRIHANCPYEVDHA